MSLDYFLGLLLLLLLLQQLLRLQINDFLGALFLNCNPFFSLLDHLRCCGFSLLIQDDLLLFATSRCCLLFGGGTLFAQFGDINF